MANSSYRILIQQVATPNGKPTLSVQAPIPDTFAFDVGSTYEQSLPQGFTNNKVINLTAAAMGSRLAVQAMTAQLWSGNTESELSVDLEFHTETDPIADVRTPIVNLLKMTMPSISSSSGMLSSPGPSVDFNTVGQVGADLPAQAGRALGGIGGALINAATNIGSGLLNQLGITTKAGSLNNTNTATNDGANNSQAAPISQNPAIGTAQYWKSRIKNQISIRIGNYLYFDSVVITRVSQTFTSNFDAVTGLPHHARVSVAFKPLFMLTQQDLDQLFVNPGSNSTPNTNNLGQALSGAALGFAVGTAKSLL